MRLSKLLGVSWRSAYRMLRVLRRRADRDRCYWLTGLVEVDDALATLGSLAERHNHTPRVTPPDQANEWPPKVHLVIANLKRFILGTVHGVSGQYLRDYIDDDSIAVVGKLNAHNG